MPAIAISLPLALLFALAAAGAPLAVYTVTLALFGLAHVASEFAYVDRRFGRRLDPVQIRRLALLLAGAALARAAGVFGLLPFTLALPVELAFVTLLILGVAGVAGAARGPALMVALPLALATALAPFETAVILSIGHNFTPLGFLWDAAPPGRRRPVMALALAGFVGLPLLVASGLPRLFLARLGLDFTGLDPMATGGIANHLHVYVPAALRDGPAAIDLFAASVVAQGAHYLAVIVILPRLQNPGARGLLPWPGWRLFAALVAGGTAVAFTGFLDDFAGTRGLYGIVASVHAWVELPLLVLILAGRFQPRASLPNRNEAPLAASDSSRA